MDELLSRMLEADHSGQLAKHLFLLALPDLNKALAKLAISFGVIGFRSYNF
jgi:hypothetical protein